VTTDQRINQLKLQLRAAERQRDALSAENLRLRTALLLLLHEASAGIATGGTLLRAKQALGAEEER
jgi:hypothetical protein